MPAHKLLLHPKDAGLRIPVDVLAEQLQAIGLIGAAIPLATGEFYPTGMQFLQLVTFLGCSPAIELDPPRNPEQLESASQRGAFCHVFIDCYAQARFRHDPHMLAPRCPHCSKPLANWVALVIAAHDKPAPAQWSCACCGHYGDFSMLQFRKDAAYASCWVEIRGIYPSEAVPGDALWLCLRNLGGVDWRAIYLQE
jgi:hypothetical protein